MDILVKLIEQTSLSLAGTRDRAILLIGFAGAFRRSELAGIRLHDITEVSKGLKVRLRQSKADPEGRGEIVIIPRGRRHCPVAALKKWIMAAEIREGYVFRRVFKGESCPDTINKFDPESGSTIETENRLTGYSIAQIVKKYASLAGVKGDFSAHSLRAGVLTSAAESDRRVPVHKIMEHSRHKSMKAFQEYLRPIRGFEDHAVEGLL